MRRIVWVWGPSVAVMAGIFFASSLSDPPAPEDVSDKALHFIAYAVLGAAFLWATSAARWRGVSGRTALIAWILAAAYGASDEFHQSFVANRYPSVGDWLADAAGAAAAVTVIALVAAVLRSGRKV